MRPAEIGPDQVRELAALDADYWWLRVRAEHVESALRRYGPGGPLDFLDLGCGVGTFLAELTQRHRPRRALGLDGTADALDHAAARGLDVRLADFREPLELPFAPNVITAMDVLEHLEDPVGLLDHLRREAAPGALLVVTVPAMPGLFGRWDELAGHHRRYTRRLLREHLERGGWVPLRTRYFLAHGVPAAWVQRRLLRSDRVFEFPRVSAPVNHALVWAGRIERWLGAPLPFGTSLLAVARSGAEGTGRRLRPGRAPAGPAAPSPGPERA